MEGSGRGKQAPNEKSCENSTIPLTLSLYTLPTPLHMHSDKLGALICAARSIKLSVKSQGHHLIRARHLLGEGEKFDGH